jgi:hypothetical protein
LLILLSEVIERVVRVGMEQRTGAFGRSDPLGGQVMHMAALQALADRARHVDATTIDITPTRDVNDEPTLLKIVESTHVLSTDRSTD